jgi:hypothetical protein
MNKVKLVLEVDGEAICQVNQNLDSEVFIKDVKEITDSQNIEAEKMKVLIKNFIDSKYQ